MGMKAGKIPLLLLGVAITGIAAFLFFRSGFFHKPLDKVSLRLNWTIYGEHAPFFTAKEKGFFRDQGLDVEILAGSGSGATVKLIAEGASDFGYADSGTVVKGIASGAKIKSVAVFTQRNTQSLMFLKDNPILEPKDIIGKKIAFTSGDATTQVFSSALLIMGIDASKVHILYYSTPREKEQAVFDGKADAFGGLYIDQLPRIRAKWKPKEVDAFKFHEHGLVALSMGIITHDNLIKRRPDLVKRFVQASQQGAHWARANPQEAASMVFKSTQGDTLDSVRTQIDYWLGCIHSSRTKDKAIGWMAAEDWAATIDLVAKTTKIEAPKDLATYFTNDFINEQIR
jgi:NitT/TauT family transport system substrate-binding protein